MAGSTRVSAMTKAFREKPASQLFAKRFRGARIALWGLGLIALAVLLGPLLWPLEAGAINLSARNQGSSLAHPLGTDQLGRDMFARLLAGGRVSLAVGLAAMILSVAIGAAVGVAAGMVRWLDGPLMRLTDLFLALPLLPLLLIAVMLFRAPLSAAFGPEIGIFILITGAIGATSWMGTARILRGDVMALMSRDFITAARASGTRRGAMAMRHILPNVASALTVSASLGVAAAILTESALSFLGLGFPPDFPTWGRMLFDGTESLASHPGRALWPGAMITAVVLCVTVLGDSLRDLADPRGAP
ncbi:ABC transporter permease [Roseovarius sp. LXJ103]|nr:ABC transporter permease [Roseovarius carneus]PWE34720.1 peptide ABC transporter [Pelagicola sp. LXJ1103]